MELIPSEELRELQMELGEPKVELDGPKMELSRPRSQLGGPRSQRGGPGKGWREEKRKKNITEWFPIRGGTIGHRLLRKIK